MDDIVPGLLDTLRKQFGENVSSSKEIAELLRDIKNGAETYLKAEEYAKKVGEALSEAFGLHLSSEVLPDGRMYFNIADRTIRPLLVEGHELVTDATVQVQTTLNARANIGIKAQTAPINTDRIDGIIQKVADAEYFDDVAWMLGEPVVNFSMSIVDKILQANIEFQGKSGLRPSVTRTSTGKCCDWCNEVVGKYAYPDVPEDVYKRHERCDCLVEYDPGDGRRQNAHTKKWRDETTDGLSGSGKSWVESNNDELIEQRKEIGDKSTKPTKTLSKQFADTPAMNEYDYFSPEQEQFRLKSIQELSGVSEAESREMLKALCGTADEYKGIGNNVPKGWFSGSDSNIRAAKSGEYFEKAKIIDSYIDKSPKYSGDIYRGLSLDDATIKQFQQGGTFVENGNLSSWTSNKSISQMFADGRSEELGTKRVIIQTSNHPNSTPASHLSIFGREESEVIVSNMKNSEYLIQNVADEDGYVLINLKLKGG